MLTMEFISPLTPLTKQRGKASGLIHTASRGLLFLAGSLALCLGLLHAAAAATENAPAGTPPDQRVVLQLTGMR
jgi:hypothetical protein